MVKDSEETKSTKKTKSTKTSKKALKGAITKKDTRKSEELDQDDQPEKLTMKHLIPVFVIAFLFIISIGFALVLAPIYVEMGLQADFEELGLGDEESLLIPLFYIVVILVFTAVILFITRKRKGRFIKYAFLGVICLSMMYVFCAIFNHLFFPVPPQSWSAEIELDDGVNIIIMDDLLGGSEQEVIIGTNQGNILVYDDNLELLWRTEQPLNDPVSDLAILDLNSDSQPELIVLAKGIFIYESTAQSNEFNVTWFRINEYYTSFVVVPDYPKAIENQTKPVIIIGSGNGMGNNSSLEMVYYNNNSYDSSVLLTFDISVNTLAYGAFEDPFNPEIFIGSVDGIYTIGSPKSAIGISSPILVIPNNEPIVGIDIVDIKTKGNSELVAWDANGALFIFEANNPKPIWDKDLGNYIGGVAFAEIFDWIDNYEMVVNVDGNVKIYYSIDGFLDKQYQFTDETGDLDPDATGLAIDYLTNSDEPDIVVGHGDGFNQYQFEYIPRIYSDVPCIMGLIVAIIISVFLFYYPEWYLVDIVGVIVAGGVAALIGISIGLLPILLLLIILAIYDAISVYKTKHMVSLADKVMEFRLPILLVVPKKRGYSFLRQKGLRKQLEEGEEREAMFIGLGDIIIPGCLVISSYRFLPATPELFELGGNLLVGIFVLVGILVGFFALMHYVLKGNPQAGLPLLNTGAIVGFFISNYLIYQDITFGLTLPFG